MRTGEATGATLRPAIISSAIVMTIAVAASACDRDRSPTQPSGTYVINGVIREALPGGTLGFPIKGVTVETSGRPGAPVSTTTDDEGRYSISTAGGSFDLKISKNGYAATVVGVEALSANRTLDAALVPVLRTLTGLVTEASSNSPIVGARVEIVSGSNKGKSTETDLNGAYTFFRSVWGDFDLSVLVAGYGPMTVRATVDETITRVDVRLNPEALMARSIFTGRLCTIAPYFPYPVPGRTCQANNFPYPLQAHHSFNALRAGIMFLGVSYTYAGDYYFNYLNVELRCASQVIAEKRVVLMGNGPPFTEPDNVRGPVQIALPQPCNYELKLFDYIADRKGGDWTAYRVEASYPK